MPFLATAGSSSGGGYGSYLILLLPLVLLGYLFWTQRKRQRATQEQQAEITVGSEAVTTSGIYGTVTAVQDPVISLEVAPGLTLNVDRRAILPRAALGGRTRAGVVPPIPAGRYGELPAGATTAPVQTPEQGTTYGQAVDQTEQPGQSQDKD
ncbi:preprotein translocase subunit YajC [Branchiibius hedensis]|uniref:Preprotein translocase subunit YajC n=1 Tax=Branchiibius hedensis TaxID=672460 RepID=A0A2Y8ZV79_9MICO|nr:preprotein translocase subunit YajC [Branchiibius hedensis]PWJ24982.1 preprotein translocase subunit YajC [Branchiibius hedensis]SSA33797.1 preprotein translocase subunit YajC [Branchiibius hedensis]